MCFSRGVQLGLAAAESLAGNGISAEVIDLRTLRPLDFEAILRSIKKTNRMVTVDESWPFGSVASELSAQAMEQAFDYLDAPISRIGGVEIPMPYSKPLEQAAM